MLLYILYLMLKYAMLFVGTWTTVANSVQLLNECLNIMVQF